MRLASAFVYVAIDRVDARGDLREHLHRPGEPRTLCGLALLEAQLPSGNVSCARCYTLAVRAYRRAM